MGQPPWELHTEISAEKCECSLGFVWGWGGGRTMAGKLGFYYKWVLWRVCM